MLAISLRSAVVTVWDCATRSAVVLATLCNPPLDGEGLAEFDHAEKYQDQKRKYDGCLDGNRAPLPGRASATFVALASDTALFRKAAVLPPSATP